jgi:hypothetical protein
VDLMGWDADGADARALDDTAPQPAVRLDAQGQPLPPHHHEGAAGHRVSSGGHHVLDVAGAGAAAGAIAVHDPDVVPHHTTSPRFGGLALGAAVVAGVVALGGVAAVGLLRPSSDATAAAAQSTAPTPGASALVTPGASGNVDATSTDVPAMLPASQPTLVLGDSLGLIVYPWLADELPDRYVSYEAQVGRSTPDTAKRLEAMPQSTIPSVVIVSSGTNDGSAAVVESSARQILDRLGPQRCVVWVDVVRPDGVGDTAPALNAALDRAVAGRPNVRVLRWSEMVAAHPEWMAGDGIHPNNDGAQARSQAFAQAAQACSPLDPSAPRAKRQILPQSIFYGPISGQYRAPTRSSGNGNGNGNGDSSSGGGATSSSSTSSSRTPSPTRSSTPSGGGSTSATAPAPPPPPPSSQPPPSSSAPAPSSSAPAPTAT